MPQMKQAKKRSRPYRSLLFLDMNTELLKLRILVAVQDMKISLFMQKFSLF